MSRKSLHAGQFVEAEVVRGKLEPALAVPAEAMTLSSRSCIATARRE